MTKPMPAAQPALWRDRRFLWLTAAWFCAILGQQTALIALPWLVLQRGGDGLALGLIVTAMELPRAVFIIVGGAVADRHSPRRVFQCSLLCCAALLALLGYAAYRGGLPLAWLYPFAAAMGVVAAFTGPSAAALLPNTVPEEKLQQANSVFMAVNQLTLLTGPMLAGALIALPGVRAGGGLSLAFLLGAACFLSAGLMLSRLRPRVVAAPAQSAQSAAGILRAIRRGAAWTWGDATLRALFFYWAVIAFLTAGPIQIGLPLLVKNAMGLDAGHFGTLLSAQGAGSLLGMAVLGLLPPKALGRLGWMVFCADALMGALIIVLGLSLAFAASCAMMFLIGLLGGLVQVRLMAWIQARIPAEMRGRVMSFLMFMMAAVTPLSTTLAGVSLASAPVRTLFVGAGLLLIGVAVLALCSPRLRAIGAPDGPGAADLRPSPSLQTGD
ncbi:MFS transporter [Chromobacterium alkanivorans]|uniref:jagaricin export MFS transporter HmlH n=1 Tax=Chromobacterium alkanivorans TaxID=1071719 RepID=UPI001967B418|nr:MFS transporter [Chromobacterium alkanivorans]MBN3006468.1 MFS transporter [Chromobacterium alkanivorans]